jgi:hypothetical protein
MKTIAAIALVSLIAASAVAGDSPCPCVPLSPLWTATACETWNCASAALVNANGDPHTFALPTASDKYTWIVIQRVMAGTTVLPDNAPFILNQYTDMNDAIAKFAGIDRSFAPIILNVADGSFLIIRLREPLPPRHRSVNH